MWMNASGKLDLRMTMDTPANISTTSNTSVQRRAPRFQIVTAAELVEVQTDTRFKARTSDLSVVGCYIDMPNPLPIGTEIKLSLEHQDGKFTARGVVALSESNLGMGISFTAVDSEQNGILESWIAKIRGSD